MKDTTENKTKRFERIPRPHGRLLTTPEKLYYSMTKTDFRMMSKPSELFIVDDTTSAELMLMERALEIYKDALYMADVDGADEYEIRATPLDVDGLRFRVYLSMPKKLAADVSAVALAPMKRIPIEKLGL